MKKSELQSLQKHYSLISEGSKNNHHEDGIMLSKQEVAQIQNAIHKNKILGGLVKVFRPNDFIEPLSNALASVGFELDTPVKGFHGSYGSNNQSQNVLLRIRKKDPSKVDPYVDHPLVSDNFQINVTMSWLGRIGKDEMNYERPMYEIIAYLAH